MAVSGVTGEERAAHFPVGTVVIEEMDKHNVLHTMPAANFMHDLLTRFSVTLQGELSRDYLPHSLQSSPSSPLMQLPSVLETAIGEMIEEMSGDTVPVPHPPTPRTKIPPLLRVALECWDLNHQKYSDEDIADLFDERNKTRNSGETYCVEQIKDLRHRANKYIRNGAPF